MIGSTYFKFNGQAMPSHWQWLLPEHIRQASFPEESWVNCQRCPSTLNGYHHPARCCTYRPQLSNFLVGLALRDGALPRTLFTTLGPRTFLPLATLEPSAYWLKRADHQRNGTICADVCHFWSAQQGCTIHKYRNGVCATFFCFTQAGDGIWQALADYVLALETTLAWWVLQECGFDLEQVLDHLAALDAQGSPAEVSALWGPYRGREAEFFERAAHLVEDTKEELYTLALGFLAGTGFSFQESIHELSTSADHPHLPLGRAALLALEQQVVDEAARLQLPAAALQLAPGVRFESPRLASWHNYYPTAHRMMVKEASSEGLADFQPLSRDEYQQVEQACGKVVKPNLVIAGLIKRGFLVPKCS
jgi:hypothetical protein